MSHKTYINHKRYLYLQAKLIFDETKRIALEQNALYENLYSIGDEALQTQNHDKLRKVIKEIGASSKYMTDEDSRFFQNLLNELYIKIDQFIDENINIICDWFEQNSQAYIIFPNGPFTFPYPYSQKHSLSKIEKRINRYILEFENRYFMLFDRLQSARIENSKLILSQYTQLNFDWYEDHRTGSSYTPHQATYSNGEVIFSI